MASTRIRDWATVDYYSILGVPPDASVDDIARAFRTLAKQLHPDAGAPIADGERFSDIVLAYDVLSNPRSRRDYDSVRAGLVHEQPRATAPAGFPSGPPPRFRAAQPRSLGWNPKRAWLAFVGGLVVTVLGVGVSLFIVGLQHHDSVRRAGRVGTSAVRVLEGGRTHIVFTTATGANIDVPAPNFVNPTGTSTRVGVLYDPRHPTDVIANESYAARDITLWIVAIKLLVGGPVFTVLGLRALKRKPWLVVTGAR